MHDESEIRPREIRGHVGSVPDVRCSGKREHKGSPEIVELAQMADIDVRMSYLGDMVVFCPINAGDIADLRSWFTDFELSRRLSYPTEEWSSYVAGPGTARCWIAREKGQAVAQLQVDHASGEPAYVSIAMRPDLRGKRVGQSVLSAFLDGPGKVYPVLVGHIEPDNIASLRCCQKCGFSLADELDQDGLIRAEFKRAQ